jgi:hypothetical protein
MPRLRALSVALLLSAAAGAETLQPLIKRPLTLPEGAIDLTVEGTYSNWASGTTLGLGPSWVAGESVALGIDFGLPDDFYGLVDATQIGIALAIPVHPAAGFGSVLGSLLVSRSSIFALRFDGGLESFGFNGDPGHALRYFIATGGRVRAPITPSVAFVMGRAGAPQFGHFTNIGRDGRAVYLGTAYFTPGASDFLVLSGGGIDLYNGTIVGVNLPVGLLVQPDPRFALTLQSGYSLMISVPGGGSAAALHFIPLVLEAVVTPASAVDIGGRFVLDGFVGKTGGDDVSIGYLERRALTIWFRFHLG